jgi:competence protein ComEC
VAPSHRSRAFRSRHEILAAARDAGIKRIDYLLITHFHPDHDGGVPELAQLIPIETFIDHGSLNHAADAGTMQAFEAYAAVRKTGRHIEPKAGDRLPIKDAEVTVVSSHGSVLANPLAGAAGTNNACGPSALTPGDAHENPRSTGILVQFGKFRFLDVGDLTGQPLFALACPNDLIGPVDVYLVAHHGSADAADPGTFAAFKPRVTMLNNGPKKGGALTLFEYLRTARDGGDVWQLHRSEAARDRNFAAERIANLDESTAHWIKISAKDDGSFRLLNGRTGKWTSYPAR